ncbi:uncharacterized protein BCR38DRAFT_353237, partial [Pseudomassariella vexata]
FGRPHLAPLLESGLNTYSSRQVQVLARTIFLVPSKVLVDSIVYFYKPWVSGRVHGYYDLQAYKKISAAAQAKPPPPPPPLADVSICRLYGLVLDDDNDYHLDSDEEDHPGTRLVGLLTYIENQGTLKDIAPWSDCTNEDRLRWSQQIDDFVDCLHDAGVAWGDAKPENILINMEGDACLIDFGDSYTRGWVDENKRETLEGDRQGVQRIHDWLKTWSEKPVTRIKRETSAVQHL